LWKASEGKPVTVHRNGSTVLGWFRISATARNEASLVTQRLLERVYAVEYSTAFVG